MTSFVGRRQALADVKQVLSTARLVTLTGFGGVGKSRLASRVGRDLRRAFPDGVWLVELARLRDPSLVGQSVAAVLELRDQSVRDLDTVLARYLADKRLLLILDNCEHLLDASRRLVTSLLRAAPGVRVLATSRESLGISGEHSWPVPPLSLPAAGSPARPARPAGPAGPEAPPRRHEALTLFEQRAAAVSPGFALTGQNEDAVARVCQRLDGVPLAIELAAVRTRMLSVDQILARLEDRFRLLTEGNRDAQGRHQTLRATVEWSHDLCSEAERTLWARCSVFAGGFDLEAAEEVCAGDGLGAEGEVFAAVTGLVDKSILSCEQHGPAARYRMLETIRHYGNGRLVESGEDDLLRRRHRDYYLRLAERSDAESCGPRQGAWMTRLRADRANLWAALDHSLRWPDEARSGLRMAAALWFYWVACGFVRDGRHWLDLALDHDTEPSAERARALWINGWIASLQGDSEASLRMLRESHELAAQVSDETSSTYARQFLGEAETFVCNAGCAGPMLDDALERHRAARHWTAPGLLIFGQRARIALLAGDVEGAVSMLEEGLALCASLNERWTLSCTEWNLGVTWWAAGNPDKTAGHVRESLRIKDELDDQFGIPFGVEVLAWVAAQQDQPRRAAMLFGAVHPMWERIGQPLFGFETLLGWSAQAKARARTDLGGHAFEAAAREGARLTQGEVVGLALEETGGRGGGAASSIPAPRSTSRPAHSSGRPEASRLTRREAQVAALVAQGMTNKQIAAELVVSQRTAETHIENILTKLGYTSRAQIAAWATEQSRR